VRVDSNTARRSAFNYAVPAVTSSEHRAPGTDDAEREAAIAMRVGKPLSHRAIAWAIIAFLGGASGFVSQTRHARALSCALPAWNLRLQSVTSSNPQMDHAAFWNAKAVLQLFDVETFELRTDAAGLAGLPIQVTTP